MNPVYPQPIRSYPPPFLSQAPPMLPSNTYLPYYYPAGPTPTSAFGTSSCTQPLGPEANTLPQPTRVGNVMGGLPQVTAPSPFYPRSSQNASRMCVDALLNPAPGPQTAHLQPNNVQQSYNPSATVANPFQNAVQTPYAPSYGPTAPTPWPYYSNPPRHSTMSSSGLSHYPGHMQYNPINRFGQYSGQGFGAQPSACQPQVIQPLGPTPYIPAPQPINYPSLTPIVIPRLPLPRKATASPLSEASSPRSIDNQPAITIPSVSASVQEHDAVGHDLSKIMQELKDVAQPIHTITSSEITTPRSIHVPRPTRGILRNAFNPLQVPSPMDSDSDLEPPSPELSPPRTPMSPVTSVSSIASYEEPFDNAEHAPCCCSIEAGKREMKQLMAQFMKDIEMLIARTFGKDGLKSDDPTTVAVEGPLAPHHSTPNVSPNLTASSQSSNETKVDGYNNCHRCQKEVKGIAFKCTSCSDFIVCGVCEADHNMATAHTARYMHEISMKFLDKVETTPSTIQDKTPITTVPSHSPKEVKRTELSHIQASPTPPNFFIPTVMQSNDQPPEIEIVIPSPLPERQSRSSNCQPNPPTCPHVYIEEEIESPTIYARGPASPAIVKPYDYTRLSSPYFPGSPIPAPNGTPNLSGRYYYPPSTRSVTPNGSPQVVMHEVLPNTPARRVQFTAPNSEAGSYQVRPFSLLGTPPSIRQSRAPSPCAPQVFCDHCQFEVGGIYYQCSDEFCADFVLCAACQSCWADDEDGAGIHPTDHLLMQIKKNKQF